MELDTELIPADSQHEGQSAYWIAYPPHVTALGSMRDRIAHATGTGDTEEEALANARS